ncbi:MAG TPA: SigB/SigF/SigG family RNA polymerase sigma factor [Solirubrobacteraceae bacterium]|jgi:RNA polymerase sigma-B factor|nr:SigB/SigF/SigG family RNA polymerase sigma factor [Solirubrobacteraceae bacterium]
MEAVRPPATQVGSDAESQRLAPLFRRAQHDGDLAAREALVKQFLPLARKLARRYAQTSEPYEDLVQVASLGLLKAIDRFEPDRGASFPAFAIPTILGELRRYFRDSTWSVRVSRTAKERGLAVADATEHLTDVHGRPPTVPELATYLELSFEEVLDGLFARRAYSAQSLDAPAASTSEDGDCTLGDTLGAEDDAYALVDDRTAVAEALSSLPERERDILRMRFLEELTQSEIAARVGVSQMQISRVLQRSLEQLRGLAGVTQA